MKKPLALIILLFSIAFNSNGQILISGKITSIDGDELPGINIIEKGTENGTVSNIEGEFTIQVADTSSILTFTFVGLKTVEIKVGSTIYYNVQMATDYAELSSTTRLLCYFPLRYTEVGFSSGVNFTPLGIQLKNLTSYVGGINLQFETNLVYRKNDNNEYLNLSVRRYGLINLNNITIGVTGQYRKLDIEKNSLKEFSLTPNFIYKGFRFSVGYAQQNQNFNDSLEKEVNGIYLGLSKYFPFNIEISTNAQKFEGNWQFDIDIAKHLNPLNIAFGAGFERILNYDEYDIFIAYRFNY